MKRMKTACAAFLLAALLLSVLPSALGCGIYGKLTRLHILANSDDERDQAIKLAVRDAVLADETARSFSQPCAEYIERIETVANRTLEEMKAEYTAEVVCVREYFDTRDYGLFSLPAGRYGAVKIILGRGQGRNWWCVLFPPLCRAVFEEELDETAEQAELSENEVKLIKKQDGEAVIRFRILEFFAELFERKIFSKKVKKGVDNRA